MKIRDFCLKQCQGLSAPASPPYPNIRWVPPGISLRLYLSPKFFCFVGQGYGWRKGEEFIKGETLLLKTIGRCVTCFLKLLPYFRPKICDFLISHTPLRTQLSKMSSFSGQNGKHFLLPRQLARKTYFTDLNVKICT